MFLALLGKRVVVVCIIYSKDGRAYEFFGMFFLENDFRFGQWTLNAAAVMWHERAPPSLLKAEQLRARGVCKGRWAHVKERWWGRKGIRQTKPHKEASSTEMERHRRGVAESEAKQDKKKGGEDHMRIVYLQNSKVGGSTSAGGAGFEGRGGGSGN